MGMRSVIHEAAVRLRDFAGGIEPLLWLAMSLVMGCL